MVVNIFLLLERESLITKPGHQSLISQLFLWSGLVLDLEPVLLRCFLFNLLILAYVSRILAMESNFHPYNFGLTFHYRFLLCLICLIC